ncbi:SulP family inorganic anion transporter [Pseudoxanthobacter sp.]|uniref:SulP family inorganic anion transporter n=1 Tax=Pseudoxanthobacter sp. TaxID=1925742 RepID=UPI002FE1E9AB
MPTRSLEPSFTELFTPKLVTVLAEHYRLKDLKADAVAGLTVAIVALPLSMAIAIASGVTPDRGLYTAIVGGFVVSLLGGSRFQIGGPAGAFIVLVSTTVATYGVDGLILATIMSGIMLMAVGLLRLGTFIKFIPYPVTVGFTAGIGVIILASQLKDLFGLTLPHGEPGPIVPKIAALASALPSANAAAAVLAIGVIALIVIIRSRRPQWPSLLIAVAVASVAAWGLGLPVETIGSKFGGIPSTLPAPSLPEITPERIVALLPVALSFTLLGSIESLLSAVVADGMTGRRHRSNCELVAQGAANIASGLFGGICVTGTIARTATNVRAGARGPVAGMLHSLFLLAFMVVAAPLAAFIPLAALAGVLALVAWNMVERHAIAALVRGSRGDAVVLAATFLLTVFRDLSEGIVVGFALGALLFLHRMATTVRLDAVQSLAPEDRPDDVSPRPVYDGAPAADREVVVYRITGAFFFGAAATIGAALDRVADNKARAFIIDVAQVPVLDSTAATTIEGFVRKALRRGALVYVSGAAPSIRRVLLLHGVRPPAVHFRPGEHEAVASAHRALDRRAAGRGTSDDDEEAGPA